MQQVAAQEEDAEAAEEAEMEEQDQRLQLEQAFYTARLAGLLAKVGGSSVGSVSDVCVEDPCLTRVAGSISHGGVI